MGTKMTKFSSPSQNNNKALILLPLYIYPSPDAWTPLLLAANRHPTLQFLVVVNPSNGPGEGDRPDENYVRVLQQLRDVENVKLVGYVYCSYGKREQGEMRRDVERYKVWGCEKRGCVSPQTNQKKTQCGGWYTLANDNENRAWISRGFSLTRRLLTGAMWGIWLRPRGR